MAVRAPAPSVDDQDYYPLHEEDDVPEIPPHEAVVRELRDVLTVRFPTWLVTGNVCIYWQPGNTQKYRAPDVFVVNGPLVEEVRRVYQTWKQPRVTFVAEIGSKSTFRKDEGPKVEIYRDLVQAEEYLYADPPKNVLRLWRWAAGEFVEVALEANGRVRSAPLDLEFGLDEAGELRVYTLDGEMLLTHQETEAARQDAEAGRQAEAAARQVEAAARQAEAAARQAAEARAAELERQLAELRARLGES